MGPPTVSDRLATRSGRSCRYRRADAVSTHGGAYEASERPRANHVSSNDEQCFIGVNVRQTFSVDGVKAVKTAESTQCGVISQS
jgi:hypothetical protein